MVVGFILNLVLFGRNRPQLPIEILPLLVFLSPLPIISICFAGF
jgi:hypothetical protein